MKIGSFFLITILVFSLGFVYLGLKTSAPFHSSPKLKRTIWFILGIFVLSPIWGFILRRVRDYPQWLELVAWLGFLSMGFFSFVLVKFIIIDLFSIKWSLLQRLQKIVQKNHPGQAPINTGRRNLLKGAVSLGVYSSSSALFAMGVHEALKDPQIVTVDVPISDLPAELENFKIVQLSDLHVGPTIKKDFVQRVVDLVRPLNAHLVALTGDFVDGSVQTLAEDTAPLANLNSVYGTYFVTGNHEYYSGALEWIQHFKTLGIVPLLNEHKIIEHNQKKLLLAGVTDYRAGAKVPGHHSSPRQSLHNAPESHIKILLAHQPKSIFAASKVGFDLQLSGHTHAGQYFPWSMVVSLVQPYVKGLNQHDKTWIYVNKGTGYWGPPVRLGVPSEITLLKLVRQS